VQRALWKNSDDLQNFGSAVVNWTKKQTREFGDSLTVKSISIDEFIRQKNLPKIDFIKLDIEGAEYECLQGAKEVIKKFKPRIAVCIYHKDEDFINIPSYLKELVPEYKLYLNHHMCDKCETVLYAIVDN
jgi:hypothetical protein